MKISVKQTISFQEIISSHSLFYLIYVLQLFLGHRRCVTSSLWLFLRLLQKFLKQQGVSLLISKIRKHCVCGCQAQTHSLPLKMKPLRNRSQLSCGSVHSVFSSRTMNGGLILNNLQLLYTSSGMTNIQS